MFTKILIANRGEIACRVIRTANTMGIKTVAVYSDADSNAQHVKLADEAVHIGESASAESYLRGDRVIAAAQKTGAQAIHPGYGFLSENAEFAEACQAANIVFIGPPVAAIKSMGSKSAAKNIMQKASVPLVPGYHGDDQSAEVLKKHADDMGYPVLLKAVAGGGGKGMRQVWSADDFDQELKSAKSEAKASFGNDDMLVEKYLTQPRHVEVQVFCDSHGNGVYLFERDCSVQRRHQKIIEEAPAPNISEELRMQMGEAAVQAARAIDYRGAGTVEFLFDTDGSFYFMEMNTRLQVEHPVTELVTGQDLVEWQLRVADGQTLPLQQEQLTIKGHAFEARIYAEDPDNDFLPVTGNLGYLQTPEENKHVRIDSGVVQGDDVSPYYDPMIAKLVVWDEDRTRALRRMASALQQYQIAGVTTNIQFLRKLVGTPAFIEADLDTGFIEKNREFLFQEDSPELDTSLALAGLFLRLNNAPVRSSNTLSNPWSVNNGWRLNQTNSQGFTINIGGEIYTITIEEADDTQARQFSVYANDETYDCSARLSGNSLSADIGGHKILANIAEIGSTYTLFSEALDNPVSFDVVQPDLGDADTSAGQNDYSAPMNGTVIEVMVEAGDTVAEGDTLLVIEAMKMQHTISASSAGVVKELFCAAGELIDGGAALLEFEAAE